MSYNFRVFSSHDVVLQVSTDGSQSKDGADMVVASTSADTSVRVVAVKELLSSLSDTSLTETDRVR